MRSALPATILLLSTGCDPLMDGNIYVEVSDESQQGWTTESPGTVHLLMDSEESTLQAYASFRLCEPTTETRVMDWSYGGIGCARPVTATAWITETAEGAEEVEDFCTEWSYGEDDAVPPEGAVSDVIFADRESGCPSGLHDEITLRL